MLLKMYVLYTAAFHIDSDVVSLSIRVLCACAKKEIRKE